MTSVTNVDRADTDVGTDGATGLGAWSLTSVTDVDRAGTDVGTDVGRRIGIGNRCRSGRYRCADVVTGLGA